MLALTYGFVLMLAMWGVQCVRWIRFLGGGERRHPRLGTSVVSRAPELPSTPPASTILISTPSSNATAATTTRPHATSPNCMALLLNFKYFKKNQSLFFINKDRELNFIMRIFYCKIGSGLVRLKVLVMSGFGLFNLLLIMIRFGVRQGNWQVNSAALFVLFFSF